MQQSRKKLITKQNSDMFCYPHVHWATINTILQGRSDTCRILYCHVEQNCGHLIFWGHQVKSVNTTYRPCPSSFRLFTRSIIKCQLQKSCLAYSFRALHPISSVLDPISDWPHVKLPYCVIVSYVVERDAPFNWLQDLHFYQLNTPAIRLCVNSSLPYR